MQVRNPDEPTTYVQAKSKVKNSKKFKTRTLTVYGATPDRVIEIVEKALRDAGQRGRSEAVSA